LLAENCKAGEAILDLAGLEIVNFNDIFKLKDIDPDSEIEEAAIKKYSSFVAEASKIKLGNRHVRDYDLYGLRIFWLTPFAEKHESYHWGFSFFVIIELFEKRKDLFENESILILPEVFLPAQDILTNHFFKLYSRNLTVKAVSSVSKQTNSSFITSLFKSLIINLRLKKQLIAKRGNNIKSSNVFVSFYPLSWNSSNKTDFEIGEIYQYAPSNGKSYLPAIYGRDLSGFKWEEVEDVYLKSFPGVMGLVLLYFQKCLLSFKIKKIPDYLINVNGLNISSRVFKNEMSEVLSNPYITLNYLWIRKYFSIKKQCKVFYSNEFYYAGRVVSAAIRNCNNNKIIGFGIQHGLLLSNLTVYKITDTELEGQASENDSIPSPQYFLVWGNYFKKLFDSAHKGNQVKTVVTGNMRYIKEKAKLVETTAASSNKIKILWCTTLPQYFKAEYQIIEPILKARNDYEITFRLHPAKHIAEEDIREWVDAKIFKCADFSSEDDIMQDIFAHDLIVTTIFSSTFLDGLVCGKKVARIMTNFIKADFTGKKIKNLFDISSANDFDSLLNSLLSNNTSPAQSFEMMVDDFCYLKADVWDSILKNDKAVA